MFFAFVLLDLKVIILFASQLGWEKSPNKKNNSINTTGKMGKILTGRI